LRTSIHVEGLTVVAVDYQVDAEHAQLPHQEIAETVRTITVRTILETAAAAPSHELHRRFGVLGKSSVQRSASGCSTAGRSTWWR